MVWSKPTTLSLHNVRLEPLSKDHLDDLIVAVKDGKLYNHWYTSIPEPKDMVAEINRRLDEGSKRFIRLEQYIWGLYAAIFVSAIAGKFL